MSIIDDALKKTQTDLEKKERKDFSIIYSRLRGHQNRQERVKPRQMTVHPAKKKKAWYKRVSVLVCISFVVAAPLFVVLSKLSMKPDLTAQISVPIQTKLSNQPPISVQKNIILPESDQSKIVAEGGVRAVEQYANGYKYDEQGNYKEAVKWYLKAAEQGHTQAQTNLGVLYSKGRWVERDYKEAVRWYRKAAGQGYARAQTNLGVMYEKGQGVEQDYEEAVRWYRKAAEQTYAHAQFNLGLMYSNGQGVEQDYDEAVRWYRRAAEQGHAQAQNSLGLRYEKGQGVEQDYKEAVGWYRKAAEQGHALAQTNLGIMYEEGHGVEQDYKEAAWWYQKAAKRGVNYAKDALKRLE
jgi:TPR repeat protein